MMKIEPFSIAVDEAALVDLRERIRRTRWPQGSAGSGWESGVAGDYLRSLLDSWADDFDWRRHERELNELSHYRAEIDGVHIHFVHERGNGRDPLPIVLTHGFPSSFLEYRLLLPLLTDPATYGGSADDAFDVVLASLPGYAFSDPLKEPFLEASVADMWCRLMVNGLGYNRFGAHGSDVGAGPTMQLGLRHPEHVIGIHLTAFYLDPPPEPWPPAVRAFIEQQTRERAPDVAYSQMQRTRPQTAAYGLTDSPAGLAAWIVDLFR
ncbi:MAG: epoxide hydrolase, partial [Actinomycetota bacterium]|nr:epoxide hydrolase [Actinomycetota bacterium]